MHPVRKTAAHFSMETFWLLTLEEGNHRECRTVWLPAVRTEMLVKQFFVSSEMIELLWQPWAVCVCHKASDHKVLTEWCGWLENLAVGQCKNIGRRKQCPPMSLRLMTQSATPNDQPDYRKMRSKVRRLKSSQFLGRWCHCVHFFPLPAVFV